MNYDKTITGSHGKIFILDKNKNSNGNIDIEDLEWSYLEGDGDFRSEEVTKLRDESDIIITNPPFSLSIPFMSWIIEADKQFSIIGNQNSITYKEIFPLLKDNKMWLGPSIHSGDREFRVPDNYELKSAGNRIDEKGNKYIRVKGVRWFTNIEHGRRHMPLSLMTISDNIKFSKHKEINGIGYFHYDNYDGIDIPYSDSIPSDFDGIMGVPVTFMDKYCPEQFEIIGCGDYTGLYGSDDIGIGRIGEEWIKVYRSQGGRGHYTANMTSLVFYDNEHKARNTFKRILIRRKENG